MSIEYLRFAPEILRRLGEELVPHPDLGVVELVRNSYDADASTCRIELDGVDVPGGRVLVADDGDGMSVDDIRDGWLLLGRSDKEYGKYSRLGRRRVGEKGLGRLAALRLGEQVTLRTRPQSSPGTLHTLRIDWQAFDGVQAVEEVPLTIISESTDEQPGTEIEISNLRSQFERPGIRRLARALLLLTGPFPDAQPFQATLKSKEYSELEQTVRNVYFDEAEHVIIATLDEKGEARAELRDWRGKQIAAGDHHAVASAGAEGKKGVPFSYFAPPADFELWTFNLSSGSFNLRQSNRTVSEVREWLRAAGGVHLYHRGLRVHPYGDDGFDWLDMNLRRVRSPEVRPGTNTSIGRVSTNDNDQLLIPKTDRTGFLENEPFNELRRFAKSVLDWAATERIRQREERRKRVKQNTRNRVSAADGKVDQVVKSLPAQMRTPVERAVTEFREAYQERVSAVEDDLQLYRTLGTVGTTTAVFAHETMRPVALIEEQAGVIDRRARKALGDRYADQLSEPISLVSDAASSLRTYAELPLRLLRRRNRRVQTVDVSQVTASLLPSFAPHLKSAEILVDIEPCEISPTVRTTVSSIEAILANLLANAAYMFTQRDTPQELPRKIVIRTTVSQQSVLLSVLDNGSGIDTERIALEDIWLPGKTTREGGTGLGLTIVRDITRDMGGAAHVKSSGELGGAEFHIELPRIDDRQ